MKLQILKFCIVILAALSATSVFAQDSSLDYFTKPEESRVNPDYEKRIGRKLKAAYEERMAKASVVSDKTTLVIENRSQWSASDPREHFINFLGTDEPKTRATETGKLIFIGEGYYSNRQVVVDVHAQYFRLLEYRDGVAFYVNLDYWDQGTLAKDNKPLFYWSTHFDFSKLAKAKYIDEQAILLKKNCKKFL
ncbi:MAG: hypothetical protein JNM93_06905 [Bacteriovoracaceae bacterium]|nr:hypothetical protein [Bacteriovoracaceae bacterium]